MVERVDEIEKYYKITGDCDTWVSRFFWICSLLSVFVLFSETILPEDYRCYPTIMFIVSVLIQVSLSAINSLFFIPLAEEKRRKQLLSDAFAVRLVTERTEGYYNNELPPSVARLGANVLENAFFAKNVCGKMAVKERFRVPIYALIYFVVLLNRNVDLGFILTLSQILFSSEILFKWLNVEVLRHRNERIYEDLYTHYRNRISNTENMGVAEILQGFTTYESAKAAASICQSSKIFHKLNPQLSADWERIREDLRLSDLEAD